MKLHPVKSSNIESIGHDGTDLHVQFKAGGLYRYKGVPLDKFNALKAAPSVGKHLSEHIRGKHDHEKVTK